MGRDGSARKHGGGGRPPRCGWVRRVATRHAAIINGIDEIAVTTSMGWTKVATSKCAIAYSGRDRRGWINVPADIELLAKCEPVYAEFPVG